MDEENGKIYRSIKSAALDKGIPYLTLYSYLTGKMRNKTKIKYYKINL